MADAEKTIETPEEDAFACSVDIKDNDAWKKSITVTIARDQIDTELNSDYKEFAQSAEVPGFRKGRAPRRLIEKRYGEDVRGQAKLRLMAKAFEKIESEQDFEVLGEPDFDPDTVELPDDGDFTFTYDIEIKPQFELPKLEGITVEKTLYEVTDDKVTETLDNLRRRQGTMEHIDKAADDDMTIADVTITIDGRDEPIVETDIPVRVADTVVKGIPTPDMAKTLAGVKVGDAKTYTATVPDSYQEEACQGKEAKMDITIKEIRRLKLAELNEEFLSNFGVASEDELKRLITENLEEQADREVRDGMKQQVYDYLDKNVTFDLPKGAAARHADRTLQRRYYELLQQGIPQDMLNENLEKLQASSGAESARQLKMTFVLEKVAETLDIQVNANEVNGFIAQTAMQYGQRPEKLRDQMIRQGRIESIQSQLASEKAIDKILEMATVVDAPEKPAAEDDTKKTAKKTAKKSTAKKVSKPAAKDADTDSSDTASPKKRSDVKRKAPKAD